MSDTRSQLTSPRPSEFEKRYRLYLDESGDHVFRSTIDVSHRFLCLLGCWFRNPEYVTFHQSLEEFKARHLPHHPDNPVILHREEIMNARGPFKSLRDMEARSRFDDDLLSVVSVASFKIVAVVIDKRGLLDAYGNAAAHPYHLGLGFLLQRYCGYLNHINRTGDVMAESRGGKEDRLLKESYEHVYERGAWRVNSSVFQSSLTSKELKLKQKSANIAGLQLSDLLGHPVKQSILLNEGVLSEGLAPFAQRLVKAVESKFNRHLYDGRVQGYGTVFFPKK